MLVLAIPNYNGGRFIEETLASLERNRPHVRWYLQDSASEDHSASIAGRFKSAIDTIIVEKDRGQTDALNRAFRRMGGEIIGYINSDDCLTEGAAEAVLRAFEDDPGLEIVYGEVEFIDAAGAALRHHAGHIESLSDVLDIYRVWWCKRQWVQPEVFFRRSLFERVGPFDESYQLAFDYQYWVRCFLAGAKVKRIPTVLTRFRLHPDQKSVRADEAADEIRAIVAQFLPHAKNRMTALRYWRLKADLEYDLYQRSSSSCEGKAKRSFLFQLVRNPHWLLGEGPRARISSALASRIG